MPVDVDGPRDTTHSGGTVHEHFDHAQYRRLIVESTYSPELEAAIAVACEYLQTRHKAYVEYLRRGAENGRPAKPGYESRSPKWREAEAASFAATNTVAAALAAAFPPPQGKTPIHETRALIERRVGPLCTGWSTRSGGVIDVHAVGVECPVHPVEPT